ncbi:helix-turn-helix transcriptional regulator [Streptacidiphilus sp. MAP12-20]|uniref:helix-turn-helix transcriptional regulator n=1 Tax=Streptacidiphilus sp. MAP12-20 TaxID=3156299 RepID=UPI00351651AB
MSVEKEQNVGRKDDHRPSRADLLALPVFVNLQTAAAVLGLGRSTAYDLAHREAFPCRVLKVGRAYRVPSEELRRLAGVEQQPAPSSDAPCQTNLRLPRAAEHLGRARRCPTCYARVHRTSRRPACPS